MPSDHFDLALGLALLARLADADDRGQARLDGRLRLGAHRFVGLVVMGAAFGMADDHILAARVLQHRGGDVARKSPARLGVAILRAEPDRAPGEFCRRGNEQSRGRTDQKFGRARRALFRPATHQNDLLERGEEAIHLPVSGHEGPHARRHLKEPLVGRGHITAARLCKGLVTG